MEPRVHFYLDRGVSEHTLEALPKKERETLLATPRQVWIFLTFLKNNRIKIYTGERVRQSVWDSGKERVDSKKFGAGAFDFNQWLSNLETKILNEIRSRYRFQRSETASPENIKALLKSILNDSREVQAQSIKTSTVLELVQKYVDKNKRDLADGTIEIFNATIEHIKEFETWSGAPLYVTADFSVVWNKFRDYFIEKKFNNSTANKYLKILRRLFKYLAAEGHFSIKAAELKSFSEIESFRIALTEDEIELLAKKTFSKAHLTQARDLMIVQLFTGQRVSDLPKILQQIKAGGDLHITQEKTNTRLTIPMYPLLETHLKAINKRHADGLNGLSEQKYNLYIKECCKAVGIARVHTYEELKGDKRESISKARYDLVSSHTCRRTFATLADKKGIGHKAIMAVTGHKSHKQFLDYIRVDDESINAEFNTKMK